MIKFYCTYFFSNLNSNLYLGLFQISIQKQSLYRNIFERFYLRQHKLSLKTFCLLKDKDFLIHYLNIFSVGNAVAYWVKYTTADTTFHSKVKKEKNIFLCLRTQKSILNLNMYFFRNFGNTKAYGGK